MKILLGSYLIAVFLWFVLYFTLPQRLRHFFLLVISVGYYVLASGLDILALGLLAGSMLVDYLLARKMPSSAHPGRLLAVSVALNLGLLALFKFPDVLLARLGDTLAMPLGLSFYTFTKLGYVIDTYQKTVQPERNFARFVTFVTFFPNITAGPIEKAKHLLPQLEQPVHFDETRTVEALRRILWGAFKKLVIADRLAVLVDYVYGNPQQFDGRILLLATVLFSIQIYADFSGYTDIALGVARLFGINLLENFNRPYFATSILDFWNRWHISLTTWIRGYVFMPISRQLLKKKWFQSPLIVQGIAYLVTMGLVGLWHGGSWTFVIWGLLHALYLIGWTLLPAPLRRPAQTLRGQITRMLVTLTLVNVAWIFFRAASVGDAIYILTHLFSFDGMQDMFLPFRQAHWAFKAPTEVGLALVLSGLLLVVDWLGGRQVSWKNLPVPVRWSLYYALLLGILLSQLIPSIGAQQFIYQQF